MKNHIGLIVAFFGLSFVACSETSEPWRADKTFTEEEQKIIIEEESWASAKLGMPARGVIFTEAHIDDTDPCTGCMGVIIKRASDGGLCQGVAGRKDEPKPKGIISLGFRTISPSHKRVIARHEFMHFMTIIVTHHDGPGIMNAKPDPNATWTVEDEEWLAKGPQE